jgi:uncharacterized protein YoxC
MMMQVWFAIISIAFLVAVGFLIFVLLELRRSASALTEFLKTTENTIKPTMEELQQTLKSIRKVTDDINEITEDTKQITGITREIGQNLKRVSGLFEEISSEAVIKVSGLRVGIRTALEVLLKNLFLKKGEN